MFILACGDNVYRLPTKYWDKLKLKLMKTCIKHVKSLVDDESNIIINKKVANEFLESLKTSKNCSILSEFEDFLIETDLYGIIHIIDKESNDSIYSVGNAYDIHKMLVILRKYIDSQCIIYDGFTDFFKNSIKDDTKIIIV